MARYKVGNGPDAWEFNAAYHAANNGDILEFEENFWFASGEQPYVISKNLTFIGTINPTESGGRNFTNGMQGQFKVTGGVEVTFCNLWFYPSGNRRAIYVTDGSTVNLETIVLENDVPDNTYALAYSEKKSFMNLDDVEVISGDNMGMLRFIGDSTVTIQNSSNLHCRLVVNQSKVTLENSVITYHDGNVINGKNNSEIILNQSTVTSTVSPDKDFPAIWLEDSELTLTNSVVSQENYTASISMNKRSVISAHNCDVSSIWMSNSVAYLRDVVADYGIYANSKSHIISKGILHLCGKLDKKIDLLSDDESSVIAECIEINRSFNPNVRIKGDSFVQIGSLIYTQGNVDDVVIETDDSSQYIQNRASKDIPDKNGDVDQEKETDALEELKGLIGLRQVKQSVDGMINFAKVNKKLIAKGKKPKEQTLHAVFVGNPGTGKTTVARLLGEALFQNGVLAGDEFKFVEVSEADLVSQNVGGTAIQTKQYLDSARGGVLFIDEAYTLNKKDSSVNFGQEAIDTIMKYMEDYRNEIMIIFAGYTKEIDEFLKTNPGLASRAPNRFIFEDCTSDEIVQLGKMLLAKDEVVLEDEDYYTKQVSLAYKRTLDKSNGRWMRNFNESLTKEQFNRIVETDSDDVDIILNVDIDNVLSQGRFEDTGREEDALEKLNSLIGINSVKQQVQEFIYQAEDNQKKEELGMKVDATSLHALFLGNPGTGKTTVARIIGKLLYQKGIIATNKFIEISRSDLVAGYVGQAAPKTREVLNSALGGVLFIDEAYTLNGSGNNDFGQEALDEILKFMLSMLKKPMQQQAIEVMDVGLETLMKNYSDCNQLVSSNLGKTVGSFSNEDIINTREG